MNFIERLIEYRESLELNKKEMASRLEVLPSTYNMIENGRREPSKNFLISLVTDSGKPEEYWLYGVNDEEYRTTRNITKSIKMIYEQIKELNLVDDYNTLFSDYTTTNPAEILLIAAVKSDLSYLLDKKKGDE